MEKELYFLKRERGRQIYIRYADTDIHVHVIYIYIYIYMCVCVCVYATACDEFTVHPDCHGVCQSVPAVATWVRPCTSCVQVGDKSNLDNEGQTAFAFPRTESRHYSTLQRPAPRQTHPLASLCAAQRGNLFQKNIGLPGRPFAVTGAGPWVWCCC